MKDTRKLCPDCQTRKPRSEYQYLGGHQWVQLPACKACISKQQRRRA